MRMVILCLLLFTKEAISSPTCSAGAVQVFKVGVAGALDGSGSSGSGTLTYAWSQTAGATATITGASTVSPSITTPSFGQYTFQLSVTDTNGTTTCTVTDGAVPVNAYDVVDMTTIDPTNGTTIQKVIGRQVRWSLETGVNRWPFWHTARKNMATVLETAHTTGGMYDPAWLSTTQVGTVTLVPSAASNTLSTVTGSGTSFQTTFCGGGTTWDSKTIFLAHVTNPTGQVGRYRAQPGTCTSDTEMTIYYGISTYELPTTTSGIAYGAYDYTTGAPSASLYGSTPENYYDRVIGLYAMYYSTGLTTYITQARAEASLWMKNPTQDYGWACRPYANGNANSVSCYMQARTFSLGGLFLCGLDSGCAADDAWDTLDNWFVTLLTYIETLDPAWGMWDQRDTSYHLQFLALYAALHPDSSVRTSSLTKLSTFISGFWTTTRASGSWVDTTGNVLVYMLAMISQSMDLAGWTLADSNPTASALAYSYAKDGVDWIIANSYITATGYRTFQPIINASCPLPTLTSACSVESVEEVRGWSMPIPNAIARVWERTGTASYRTLLIDQISSQWSNTEGETGYDGTYLTGYVYPGGWYMISAGMRDKWWGEPWGWTGQGNAMAAIYTAPTVSTYTFTGGTLSGGVLK